MLLLIESGSTKSDWVILEAEGRVKVQFASQGFNPNFHSSDLINGITQSLAEIQLYADQIAQVIYYGAGCSSLENKMIVKNALRPIFSRAEIKIYHDLEGAVLACTQGRPGFACILGTGSNAAYFNGKEIEPIRGGFGYILGDEGSGTHLGKKLLSAYLYGQLEDSLCRQLEQDYQTNKDDIINKVYRMPNANVFLASFSPFLKHNEDRASCHAIITSSLEDFLRLHLLSHPQAKTNPINFVGSIAHHFKNQLAELCVKHELILGEVIKSPIIGLISYHQLNNKQR